MVARLASIRTRSNRLARLTQAQGATTTDRRDAELVIATPATAIPTMRIPVTTLRPAQPLPTPTRADYDEEDEDLFFEDDTDDEDDDDFDADFDEFEDEDSEETDGDDDLADDEDDL